MHNGFGSLLKTLGATCVVLCSCAAHAQDCSAIVPVMKLVNRTTDNRTSMLAVADYLETSSAHSFQELESESRGLGLSYAGFGVNFNGQNANSNFQAWKEAVVHELRSQANSSSATTVETQTIATAAVEAWSKCVDAPGLHVWALLDDTDPKSFTFYAKYLSTDAGNAFVGFQPKLTTSDGVTCDDLVGYGDATKKHKLGGASTYETHCVRTDRSIAASATLATELGGKVVRVPARPLCVESVELVPSACSYPMTEGTRLMAVRTCIGGDERKSSRILQNDSCKDVGCRTSVDIVHELTSSLYGTAGSDAEVASLAAQLDSRAIPDVPTLITTMAMDQRFFDKQFPQSMFQQPPSPPYFAPYSPPSMRTGAICDRPTAEKFIRQIMNAVGAHPPELAVTGMSANPNILSAHMRGVPNQLCHILDPAGVKSVLRVSTPYIVTETGNTKVPSSIIGNRDMHMCSGLTVKATQ